MIEEIFSNIILNISVLILTAYLLTKIQLVRDFIFDTQENLMSKIILAIIFGLMGIASTYTGVSVHGAIANTRAISIIAGGLIGGPLVGLGAGLIAGVHRYLIDVGGFTALACALSTIFEGLIGGFFCKKLNASQDKWIGVFFTSVLAEILQMIIILFLAKPFTSAVYLIKVISVPMIFLNSIGVALFITIFDSIFIEQDHQSAIKIKLSLDIADKCLPYLRKGLYDKESLDEATKVILNMSGVSGVLITDTHKHLSWAGKPIAPPLSHLSFPLNFVSKTISTGSIQIADKIDLQDPFFKEIKTLTAIAAPLTKKGELIGCIVLFIKKFKLSNEAETGFIKGLSKLFSTQLELAELDCQKKMLQKAEFQTLQAQINPHFLFNALSTISAFCREKPEHAQKLLLILSTYFRQTLQNNSYMVNLSTELEHINCYLQLEKARFEEKLEVKFDIAPNINCHIPHFILQPLVENAIKHGAMSRNGRGIVSLSAYQNSQQTTISIKDNGKGIDPSILDHLYSDTLPPTKVGLTNVHKRLKSIYGNHNGLKIETDCQHGTNCIVHIPNSYGGDLLENSPY